MATAFASCSATDTCPADFRCERISPAEYLTPEGSFQAVDFTAWEFLVTLAAIQDQQRKHRPTVVDLRRD
jgi:hypothetical protein